MRGDWKRHGSGEERRGCSEGAQVPLPGVQASHDGIRGPCLSGGWSAAFAVLLVYSIRFVSDRLSGWAASWLPSPGTRF